MPVPNSNKGVRPLLVQEVTVEELFKQIDTRSSTLGRATSHHVAVDVGATNCRIGLVAKGDDGMHEISFCKFPANSVSELIAVMNKFVELAGPRRLSKITRGACNVPGPVAAGRIGGPVVNYKGETAEDKLVDLRKFPQELFPRGSSVMLNDLEAGAEGIIATSVYNSFPGLFELMWEGSSRPKYENSLGRGHCVVLAPGTGLGVALIQYHPIKRRYTVMPLEFGHVNVSSTEDRSFLEWYRREAGYGDRYEVEYDDLCSGRGLERAYQHALHQELLKNGSASCPAPAPDADRAPAAAIGRAAQGGVPVAFGTKKGVVDPKLALEAFRMYNKFVMHIASNMTMGFQPRTVILCGDNTVKNKFVYDDAGAVAEMKSHFKNHSMERYGFMSKAHVVRQTQPANLNMLGCAYVCETMNSAVPGSSKI
jgi:glucokinase